MNQRIKQLRTALNLSQEEFGRPLGVKRSSVCLIESGERNVSNQVLVAICREYNVNEEWLRNGSGDMFVDLSRQEQAALLVGKAFATNDPFIINAFVAIAELPPEDLEVIKRFINKLKAD